MAAEDLFSGHPTTALLLSGKTIGNWSSTKRRNVANRCNSLSCVPVCENFAIQNVRRYFLDELLIFLLVVTVRIQIQIVLRNCTAVKCDDTEVMYQTAASPREKMKTQPPSQSRILYSSSSSSSSSRRRRSNIINNELI